MSDTLVIEDDDGFRTEWPFPDGSSALRQADFIDMCCILHDQQRATCTTPPEVTT